MTFVLKDGGRFIPNTPKKPPVYHTGKGVQNNNDLAQARVPAHRGSEAAANNSRTVFRPRGVDTSVEAAGTRAGTSARAT